MKEFQIKDVRNEGPYLWAEWLCLKFFHLIVNNCYFNLNCSDGGQDSLRGRILKENFLFWKQILEFFSSNICFDT